jgi:3'-5' exoribonuclease
MSALEYAGATTRHPSDRKRSVTPAPNPPPAPLIRAVPGLPSGGEAEPVIAQRERNRSLRAVLARPVRARGYLGLVLVREFADGVEVDAVLLVREAEVRSRRNGGEYLKLTLGDRSGVVAAVVWEDIEPVIELARPGQAVRVCGRFARHERYGPQLTVRALQEPAPDRVRLEELLDGPPRDADQMEADLRQLLATIQNPHLRGLLDRVFGAGSDAWAAYRVAPAAKYYHQAYRHGLLEHCLTVAQAVSAISATFPGIDRDVAVTGALLHDVGKLEAYTAETPSIDLTDAGRLQGEIALGYFRVRSEIDGLESFPPDLGQAVLHIILSHHGALEHGSPVVPCTREATLVHMIDNLGGRLGSFDRLEKELPDGTQWSGFDRAIGTGAFFASRQPARADREAA